MENAYLPVVPKGLVIINIWLIFLLIRLPVDCQDNPVYNPYYRFESYSKKDGLSGNRINTLFQDQAGQLWIGTNAGLNSFNGYDFDTYPLDSINTQTIFSIKADDDNIIWVGTEKGLYRSNEGRKKFIRVFPGEDDVYRKVMAIHIDSNGIIWFDLASGDLKKLNPANAEIKSYKHEKAEQTDTYFYHSLYEDEDNRLWIGGRAMPICYFDKKSERFQYFRINKWEKGIKFSDDVSFYYLDKEDNFWVGAADGLFQLNKTDFSLKKVLAGSSFDIAEYGGKLWVINSKRIKILDYDGTVLEVLDQEYDHQYTLPSNYLFCFLKDYNNNLWIGTLEGLSIYSSSRNKFSVAYQIHGNDRTLSSDKISAIEERQNGEIWIGSQNQGIDVLDKNLLRIKSFKRGINSQPLCSNSISTLLEDPNQNMIIGTWSGHGFNTYSNSTKTFSHHKMLQRSTVVDWYSDFEIATNGDYWIGSWGSFSLVRFDPSANEFLHRNKNLGFSYFPHLGSHFLTSIKKDNTGAIWLGSSNKRLTKLNPQNGDTIHYNSNFSDTLAHWGDHVKSIICASDGTIYTGSKGVNIYNQETDHFDHLTEENGLSDDNVLALVEDENNRIWIGTENGLSCYNPKNGSIRNYSVKDGLPSNEFTSAAKKLEDGRILMGTKKGIVNFHPDSISKSAVSPIPSIRSIALFEKEIDDELWSNEYLVLPYDKNYLSFDLGSSDLSDPKNNSFSYRMYPFEDVWKTSSGKDPRVTYTYLKPGKYKFELRTANPDGTWSEKTFVQELRIMPPFWARWWFITICILIILSLVYFYIRFREQRIRNAHYLELVEQRLLRSQMNPHFIFNALAAIQSYIFKRDPVSAGTYLSNFAELMRSILYSSREEEVRLEKELDTLEKYMQIQQLRFEERFDYKIEEKLTSSKELLAVPPMLMQPFIENSIEHGFKNLDHKGYIYIGISEVDNHLHFTIEDNGVGITKSVKTTKKKHKSLAMEITKERLKKINRKGPYDSSYLYIISAAGDGVKVEFKLPVKYIEH